jgi:uncharacterized protein
MSPLGLQFKLDEVPEDPRAFEGEIEAPVLDETLKGLLGELGDRARGAARVSGSVYRSKRDIFVEAEVIVKVGFDCVRCLDPLDLSISRRFRHLLVPGKRDEGAADIDLTDEEAAADDDLDHYEGERIDLVALLREDILLELPMNPTCVESAGEPCARFDTALRTPVAEVEAAPVDPRWAPLLELKKKLN